MYTLNNQQNEVMSITTPVKYITTFKSSELTTRKIENGTKSVKCPTFSGSEGLEALFHVIHYFERIAVEDLELFIDGRQAKGIDYHLMFKLFKHILNDSALLYWEELMKQGSYAEQSSHTKDNWDQVIKEMKKAFAGGAKARDNILKYLASRGCKKQVDTSVDFHVRRISQLIEYANESEGLEAKVTLFKRNDIIIQTLPAQWRHVYASSGKDITIATLQELIDFFSLQKDYFDRVNQMRVQRRTKRNNPAGSFKFVREYKTTGESKLNETHPGKRKLDGNERCPIHLNGTHRWIDCYLNQESPNYKAKHAKFNPQQSTNIKTSTSNQAYGSPYKGDRKKHGSVHEQHYEESNERESDEPQYGMSIDDHHDEGELHVYDVMGLDPKPPNEEDATSRSIDHTASWWKRPDQPFHMKKPDGT